jgi:predicted AAA+ superfamily ATPase
MRAITPWVTKDLSKKMVFIGGPRQCGKTTLAQQLMKNYKRTVYFNWDDDIQRNEILQRQWLPEDQLLVFDELHKLKKWKSWIKGIYDTQKSLHQFLVTGSARLDVYRRGGDSLLGRYHYWRLHPFTLSEIPAGISQKEAYSRLLRVGGFPEPFMSGDETQARRWRKERLDRVVRDDIRDLESVRDIKTLELLVSLLRNRVGGPVVVKNLAEDLQVSQPTVKQWLEVLERMYLIFLVYPYSENLPRAILKPPKIYFFDNADVQGDVGAQFENLVATHLLKSLHFLEDRDGYRYELRYIGDKEGREVDFVLLKEKKIVELIEAKWSDRTVSHSLQYYSKKLKAPMASQIIGHPDAFRGFEKDGVRVISALEDLSALERKSLLA